MADIKRKPVAMNLNQESNGQNINPELNPVQRKKEKRICICGNSFYYIMWTHTSQYFNISASGQSTSTVPLCNFYSFSFVLLQCRLLALYLEDEQNTNYFSRNNILGANNIYLPDIQKG
jgi:hypothetical protein